MGLSCFKSWKRDSTGHKGNRDVLASPGSYFFLSNSAGQGDEWLKSLNKGVWIPFTGVFGQSLEETMVYERRYGMRLVPLVVEQCVTFIRERGMHEVGLFRLPGRASLVKELQEAFHAGERPSFDSNTDVHTVASLLKLYLRQLPEPLVPYSRYKEFLRCGQKLSSDRTLGLGELRNLLCELPVANFNLLNFICHFLNEVQSRSSRNKMSVQNLATVFGPNVLRAKADNPQSIMGGAALVQALMLEMIREHESLFAKVPPCVSARLPGGSQASTGALRHPHLQPPPCVRQLSLPLMAEPGEHSMDTHNSSWMYPAAAKSDVSSGQKRPLGHRYTSSHPETCFFPRPSSNQPHQHHTGQANTDYQRHPAGQRSSPANCQASTSSLQLQDPLPDRSKPRPTIMGWEKAWPSLGEGGSCFWSSAAAVTETASGGSSEAQEDSTLSAYDNLRSESPSQRKEAVTGTLPGATDPGGLAQEAEREEAGHQRDSSSSWSSCEVLPLDESDDTVSVVNLGMSPKRSKQLHPSQEANEESSQGDEHKDKSNEDEDEVDDGIVPAPNPPASCSEFSISPVSTGSSEVFLPSASPDLQGPEAHCLLAELQQQMAQQEAEYQARIQRLERCNDLLKHQVAALRRSLEQQRRSQSIAEVQIRNMERDKAHAERRNSALQREMELFFQMYGELGQGGGGGSL